MEAVPEPVVSRGAQMRPEGRGPSGPAFSASKKAPSSGTTAGKAVSSNGGARRVAVQEVLIGQGCRGCCRTSGSEFEKNCRK
jgi:hypothetical protein